MSNVLGCARLVWVVLSSLVTVGCTPAPAQNVEDRPVDAARDSEALPQTTQATITRLHTLIHEGSLRALERFADTQMGFSSNFGGERHYEYWYVLRRTGVDPLAQLARVLAEPHGEMTVGEEIWYIWPDLSARPNAALQPERLSFRDKARLHRLVGSQGLIEIEAGGPYPGFRTAVSNSGRWVYFLYETTSERETP